MDVLPPRGATPPCAPTPNKYLERQPPEYEYQRDTGNDPGHKVAILPSPLHMKQGIFTGPTGCRTGSTARRPTDRSQRQHRPQGRHHGRPATGPSPATPHWGPTWACTSAGGRSGSVQTQPKRLQSANSWHSRCQNPRGKGNGTSAGPGSGRGQQRSDASTSRRILPCGWTHPPAPRATRLAPSQSPVHSADSRGRGDVGYARPGQCRPRHARREGAAAANSAPPANRARLSGPAGSRCGRRAPVGVLASAQGLRWKKKITQNAHRHKHTPHTLRKRRRGRLSPGTRAWFFGELRRVTKTSFLFVREWKGSEIGNDENGGGRPRSRELVALSEAQPQPDGGRELFWARCHCTVAMAASVAERRVSSRALQPDSTGLSCLPMCAVPCLGQTHGGAYGDMPVCD